MGQCSQKENCCGGAPNEENLDKLGAPILPSDYADQQTMAQMSEEDDADLIDSMQSGGYFERDLGELRRIAKMPKKMEDGVCVSFKSGAKYTGQWKENMRHGKGTMVWSDGAMYEGEWEKKLCGWKREVHSHRRRHFHWAVVLKYGKWDRDILSP